MAGLVQMVRRRCARQPVGLPRCIPDHVMIHPWTVVAFPQGRGS
jgi:hypothetical protein